MNIIVLAPLEMGTRANSSPTDLQTVLLEVRGIPGSTSEAAVGRSRRQRGGPGTQFLPFVLLLPCSAPPHFWPELGISLLSVAFIPVATWFILDAAARANPLKLYIRSPLLASELFNGSPLYSA